MRYLVKQKMRQLDASLLIRYDLNYLGSGNGLPLNRAKRLLASSHFLGAKLRPLSLLSSSLTSKVTSLPSTFITIFVCSFITQIYKKRSRNTNNQECFL